MTVKKTLFAWTKGTFGSKVPRPIALNRFRIDCFKEMSAGAYRQGVSLGFHYLQHKPDTGEIVEALIYAYWKTGRSFPSSERLTQCISKITGSSWQQVLQAEKNYFDSRFKEAYDLFTGTVVPPADTRLFWDLRLLATLAVLTKRIETSRLPTDLRDQALADLPHCVLLSSEQPKQEIEHALELRDFSRAFRQATHIFEKKFRLVEFNALEQNFANFIYNPELLLPANLALIERPSDGVTGFARRRHIVWHLLSFCASYQAAEHQFSAALRLNPHYNEARTNLTLIQKYKRNIIEIIQQFPLV